MESKKLKAKIFTIKDFYKHLKIAVSNFKIILQARKSESVSKAFSEKIMLAVTQVNGCRLCNYVHTKNAIDAGASEEELNAMFNGDLGDLGNDESLALMFAQHYADTDGDYNLETYNKFVEHYGKEKAQDILALIRVIMAANIHGISVDALKSRIKGEKMNDSKFIHEVGITLGIIVFIPVAIVQIGIEKLFVNKSPQEVYS